MRLIDADALLKDMETICNRSQFGRQTAKMCVKNAPTVDAVSVVRCSQCVYSYPLKEAIRHMFKENARNCILGRGIDIVGVSMVHDDFFCNNGERKEPTDDL